jgi:hypothetical protein
MGVRSSRALQAGEWPGGLMVESSPRHQIFPQAHKHFCPLLPTAMVSVSYGFVLVSSSSSSSSISRHQIDPGPLASINIAMCYIPPPYMLHAIDICYIVLTIETGLKLRNQHSRISRFPAFQCTSASVMQSQAARRRKYSDPQ